MRSRATTSMDYSQITRLESSELNPIRKALAQPFRLRKYTQ
jgi:hypothetical protein